MRQKQREIRGEHDRETEIENRGGDEGVEEYWWKRMMKGGRNKESERENNGESDRENTERNDKNRGAEKTCQYIKPTEAKFQKTKTGM